MIASDFSGIWTVEGGQKTYSLARYVSLGAQIQLSVGKDAEIPSTE